MQQKKMVVVSTRECTPVWISEDTYHKKTIKAKSKKSKKQKSKSKTNKQSNK
jgi:hypothetical protein